MKSNIPEFHVMRAMAIFIILFHHLPLYTFNFYDLHNWGFDADISWLNDLNRYFALGIFIFISGYLMNMKDVHLDTLSDVKAFLIKRYIRIFPLYLLALGFFIFFLKDITGDIGGISLIIHLLGLQILLASKYCDPILTLWYVGLTFTYYYLFIILAQYHSDMRKYLLFSLLILCAVLILKVFLHVIDKRFILYYAIFIFGIICSSNQLLLNLRMKQLPFITIPFVVSIFLYVLYVYPKIFLTETPPLFSMTGLYAFVLINLIMFFSIFMVYLLAIPIIHWKINPYVEKISYASFCMFLFHRPIYWLFLVLWKPDNIYMRFAYLSLIGVPGIVLSSYYIQYFYDRHIGNLLTNRLLAMR